MINANLTLKLEEVSKTYKTLVDEVSVFEGLNYDVAQGEAVALMGESGSGKTTALNIMSGLDYPTKGKVFFEGKRIDCLDEDALSEFRNQKVGFIFQHHFLLDDFNALENVLLPLRIAEKKINAEVMERAMSLMHTIGLSSRLKHFPDQLSGGERQRVAIIRALINQPKIIFADEPTGSLDKKNAENVENILWELKNQHKITLVIATHSREIADRCDRVIQL